jgi:hypothetical protein
MTRISIDRSLAVLRIGLLALLLAFACLGAARADVTGVTVTPGQVTVGLQGGGISLTWRVEVRGPRAGGQATISSPSLVISDGAQVLFQSGRLLTRTVTLAPLATQTLVFTESLSLPPNVAQYIAKGSGAGALFQRGFSDSNTPGVQVTARGGLSVAGGVGGLDILRLDLAFEGGDRTRVLPAGEELTAIADLSFSGNGTLQAEWRVTTADGLRGSGLERRISQVRRPLVGSGSGRTRIESPSLPTDASGLYEVAFVVLEEGREALRVAIRYYVQPGAIPPLAAIDLLAPAPETALTEETRFAWRPVEGAAAYQIEVFEEVDELGRGLPQTSLLLDLGEGGLAPITGSVVPGGSGEAYLTTLTLRHLEAGRDYRWRVRALGPDGKVLGASAIRPIRR